MDAVPVSLDEPMSEDFALVGVNDLTNYLGYFFPNQLEQTFRRTVLFEGVGQQEIDRWAAAYDHLLRKATVSTGGRSLVTKNPPNTGRIPYLLERFPRSKFVYVYRNPLMVYGSTCRQMEKFLERWSLQRYDRRTIKAFVLRRQELLLKRYLEVRERIPAGQLVEIRHEDLISDSMATIEKVYRTLDLPGFELARPRIQAYVEQIQGYQGNGYEFDPATVRAVRDKLGFALEAWNYDVPGPQKTVPLQSNPSVLV